MRITSSISGCCRRTRSWRKAISANISIRCSRTAAIRSISSTDGSALTDQLAQALERAGIGQEDCTRLCARLNASSSTFGADLDGGGAV